MAVKAVRCPHCRSEAVVKYGQQWERAGSLSAGGHLCADVYSGLCLSGAHALRTVLGNVMTCITNPLGRAEE